MLFENPVLVTEVIEMVLLNSPYDKFSRMSCYEAE